MPLIYTRNPAFMVRQLEAANDAACSPIRASMLAAEREFWREHVCNKSVLVVGSGLGHDTFDLARFNQEVVGIDLITLFVEIANAQLTSHAATNVSFVVDNFFTWDPGRSFDVAVLNMGTIGNFDDPVRVMQRLLELAPAAYFDFYLPGNELMLLRQKMYEQEGWKSVCIVGNTALNYQGLDSTSFDPEILQHLASQADIEMTFWPLVEFAVMAGIRSKV